MKNNRGITLITLTVAVLIMIILSSMLIYNAKNGLKMKNLKDMQNDIEILEDKVNAYYVKYADIPAEIEYLGNINFEPQPNDDDEYYVLDLKALEGISLNYGSEFTQIKTREDTYQYNDVYIINKQSLHIYYAKGVEIDGVAYYTNSEDESVTSYRGTYVIGQKGYAETLEKAIEIAENGDTIKLLKDVEENTPVEIKKNIVIDTNGKNISYKGEQVSISINNSANVKIIGNGIIKIENDEAGSSIMVSENCNLTIEDTLISSNNSSRISGTLYSKGQINLINAKIDSIFVIGETGKITVDKGEYNSIECYFGCTSTINGGIIKKIRIDTDGDCTINKGNIGEITINPDILSVIKLTIGDNTESVNVENLKIDSMKFDVAPTTDEEFILTINNGIIKELDDDLKAGILDGISGTSGGIKIRDGYKVKKTTDGYILVPQT